MCTLGLTDYSNTPPPALPPVLHPVLQPSSSLSSGETSQMTANLMNLPNEVCVRHQRALGPGQQQTRDLRGEPIPSHDGALAPPLQRHPCPWTTAQRGLGNPMARTVFEAREHPRGTSDRRQQRLQKRGICRGRARQACSGWGAGGTQSRAGWSLTALRDVAPVPGVVAQERQLLPVETHERRPRELDPRAPAVAHDEVHRQRQYRQDSDVPEREKRIIDLSEPGRPITQRHVRARERP